jgi:hypothetical protein
MKQLKKWIFPALMVSMLIGLVLLPASVAMASDSGEGGPLPRINGIPQRPMPTQTRVWIPTQTPPRPPVKTATHIPTKRSTMPPTKTEIRIYPKLGTSIPTRMATSLPTKMVTSTNTRANTATIPAYPGPSTLTATSVPTKMATSTPTKTMVATATKTKTSPPVLTATVRGYPAPVKNTSANAFQPILNWFSQLLSRTHN